MTTGPDRARGFERHSLPPAVRLGVVLVLLLVGALAPFAARANPWNGKVVLQAFWWDARNDRYPHGWYTYLAKLAPRLRRLGFDGIWIPPPSKGNAGGFSMGYDVFDHYDLGSKDQKGGVATRFGTQDELLRLVAVAHANGLEVYPDIVLNHVIGGREAPDAAGDKFKTFRYHGFGGPEAGRWPKDHPHFHPNPGHPCIDGDVCAQMFGPDVCYRDPEHGGGESGRYMRDRAREWLVWLRKQTGADGFRFDAVKHYPPYVVEDLLFHAMGPGMEYFCVGELVGGKEQLDAWVAATQDRCGTFDFALRQALADVVERGGFFDMGSLPGFQQGSRRKTVPFVNNHDTWRGSFWDSRPGSTAHDDRDGDFRQNGDELAPTIDPDNPRADIAYAAAFAVDGSPVVFYEDLFENSGPGRFQADPERIATRDYLVNLVWAHQKLDFKDGAYRVPFQGSQDLLVIERAGKALIGLNDHGAETLTSEVRTSFGPHVRLHDYSGANRDDVTTDGDGRVTVSVPPMRYAIWAPAGVVGGFAPPARRTTQEFQLDDDLGDTQPSSLGYGGRITPAGFRTAGAVWAAAHTTMRVSVFTDGGRDVELRVARPDARGRKSSASGHHRASGPATSHQPLELQFTTAREGYHRLVARLADASAEPTRAWVKVDYEAPARSELIEP